MEPVGSLPAGPQAPKPADVPVGGEVPAVLPRMLPRNPGTDGFPPTEALHDGAPCNETIAYPFFSCCCVPP